MSTTYRYVIVYNKNSIMPTALSKPKKYEQEEYLELRIKLDIVLAQVHVSDVLIEQEGFPFYSIQTLPTEFPISLWSFLDMMLETTFVQSIEQGSLLTSFIPIVKGYFWNSFQGIEITEGEDAAEEWIEEIAIRLYGQWSAQRNPLLLL